MALKIYTKTGDKGQTSLIGGQRVPKDDRRIDAFGAIDELNAQLGFVVSLLPKSEADLEQNILAIQHHLFDLGAELASLSDIKTKGMKIPKVSSEKVTWLEELIDRFDKELVPLRNFILPGGSAASSALQVARAVCRRAERRIISITDDYDVNPELIKYVNRLSDFLFTAARLANVHANTPDVTWKPNFN